MIVNFFALCSLSHDKIFLMFPSLILISSYLRTVPVFVPLLGPWFLALLSGPLPGVCSAQVAELVALTEALQLADGHSATIYTNSRYAFGVVHDFGQLWNFMDSLQLKDLQ